MSPRAAQVRFYVDADLLGLGKILGSLRDDVTYPGDPGAVPASDTGHLARSQALMYSTRTGYPRWPPGDG